MNKPIVVFDTNIFISATFWEGKSYYLLKKAINQEIIVFISKHIIGEIKNVLKRDFYLEKQEVDDVINSLLYFTHLVDTKDIANVIKEDPIDNRILDCALACNASLIISQDKHLLKLKKFRSIAIMSPEEFTKSL